MHDDKKKWEKIELIFPSNMISLVICTITLVSGCIFSSRCLLFRTLLMEGLKAPKKDRKRVFSGPSGGGRATGRRKSYQLNGHWQPPHTVH